MANIIEMPKLSDTMTVGTLVKWLKKEGDAVKTGDILAEVETDKATMELESFFDGSLVAIFIPEGSQVPIGAAVCAIGKPGEKVDAPKAPEAAAPAAPSPAPSAPAPAPKPSAFPASTPAALVAAVRPSHCRYRSCASSASTSSAAAWVAAGAAAATQSAAWAMSIAVAAGSLSTTR